MCRCSRRRLRVPTVRTKKGSIAERIGRLEASFEARQKPAVPSDDVIVFQMCLEGDFGRDGTDCRECSAKGLPQSGFADLADPESPIRQVSSNSSSCRVGGVIG